MARAGIRSSPARGRTAAETAPQRY